MSHDELRTLRRLSKSIGFSSRIMSSPDIPEISARLVVVTIHRLGANSAGLLFVDKIKTALRHSSRLFEPEKLLRISRRKGVVGLVVLSQLSKSLNALGTQRLFPRCSDVTNGVVAFGGILHPEKSYIASCPDGL